MGFLAVSCLACGCQAMLVESRPRRQAGAAMEPGGGEVKYSLDGWAWLVRSRAEDARARMESACKPGTVKVLEEVDRETQEAQFAPGELAENVASGAGQYRGAPYRHVYFECVEGGKP